MLTSNVKMLDENIAAWAAWNIMARFNKLIRLLDHPTAQ